MKTILSSSLVLLVALVLGACSGTTDTAPADTFATVESPSKGASVQGATVEKRTRTSSFLRRNPCTGAFYLLRMTTTETTVSKDRGDGTREVRVIVHVKGEATDRDGNAYRMNSTSMEVRRIVTDDECPTSFQEVANMVITTPGKGNNWVAKVRFKVTTDCDGNITVTYNVDEGDCK